MSENVAFATAIAGVLLQPLAVIPAAGGPVLHMLRAGQDLMASTGRFGEIYFSEVLPGEVKAWKRHKRQIQRFAVPMGKIRIVLFDSRSESPTRGSLLELELGRPDHYSLLLIPPAIWYGFTALSATPALICNCADLPHDPDEGEKRSQDCSEIPYSWS